MGKKHRVASCSRELKQKCSEGTYCRLRTFSMRREDGPKQYKPNERAKFAAKRAREDGYIPLKNKNGFFVAPRGHGGKGHVLGYKCHKMDEHKKRFREDNREYTEIFKIAAQNCSGIPKLDDRNACFKDQFQSQKELRGL